MEARSCVGFVLQGEDEPVKRTPMPRPAKPMARTRLQPKRTKTRRVAVLRDRGYLDWLKRQKCAVGNAVHRRAVQLRYGCDPAHGPSNGTGSKGPDDGAIPLCRHHHNEQHQIGWPAFEAKYGFSREAEAIVYYQTYLIDKEHRA